MEGHLSSSAEYDICTNDNLCVLQVSVRKRDRKSGRGRDIGRGVREGE